MAENDSWNNGSAQNRGISNAGNGANGMNGRSSQAVRDALFDRVPPHDDAAEMAVLGGMLMSKDAIGEVSQMIDVSDFYQPRTQTVYAAVIKLFSASQPVGAVLVADGLTCCEAPDDAALAACRALGEKLAAELQILKDFPVFLRKAAVLNWRFSYSIKFRAC